ncbi:MAG: hypothetical protein ACI8PZ_005487 [Myxococcota bacterium]|jgi:hypothetical protein
MRERVTTSLYSAWLAESDDPVGLLLPAGGLASLDLAALVALRATWHHSAATWAIVWAGTLVALWILRAPFRAIILHRGALAAGLNSRGRWLPLVGVHIGVGLAQAFVAGLVAVPGVIGGGALVASGWYSVGTAVIAITASLATLLAFIVRAVFAFAPAEAVVNGHGLVPALSASWRRSQADVAATAIVVFIGDAATVLGGLACGAGSLPGYPLSDLALVRRMELP